MQQQALMKFDPATGETKPYPSHAEQWREWHGYGTAWLFNPWTGGRRSAGDVGTDVLGRLIQPPTEPLYAAQSESNLCGQQQAQVPVKGNHLTCCKGVKTRECPHLVALEKIERCKPEDVDTAKAWTCAAHIVSTGGDYMGEGYLLRVDDRMFWDNVNESLSQDEAG